MVEIIEENIKKRINSLLLFSIGGNIYASSVSFIRQIVKDTSKTPIPGSPDFIPGAISIREEIVKIIDIRKIIPLGADSERKRVIVFIPETEAATRFGIVVDDVFGIMDIPDDKVNYLDLSDKHIENNFMIGFIKISMDEFLNQASRAYVGGNDDVVWIDFEDLISSVTSGQEEGIVFKLTALFNPDLLLSGEWKSKN